MKTIATSASSVQLVTQGDLTEGLAGLGLGRGDVAVVHCSLSAFGMVVGGEQTVLASLNETLGPEGTLVMPSQSWQLCDPEFLADARFDASARRAIRDALPPYDAHLTPTRSMGAVAELFRMQPGALRSPHPHRSFAALGPLAGHILGSQENDDPFGCSSPIARLVELDAMVLLLGVGFDRCTELHHAEILSGTLQGDVITNGARLKRGERTVWTSWSEPRVRSDDFADLGRDAEGDGGLVQRVTIGRASCRAVRARALTEFATEWFRMHRG
ncbi:aminoglycoside N(3)-acetyltransferase [Oerskovia enterophila]|uniref:aminoglycoside N(3)-acetyltransferase n=1 Tax=Oerskovia enterophila TaxID=43678 RepID=UPI0033939621